MSTLFIGPNYYSGIPSYDWLHDQSETTRSFDNAMLSVALGAITLGKVSETQVENYFARVTGANDYLGPGLDANFFKQLDNEALAARKQTLIRAASKGLVSQSSVLSEFSTIDRALDHTTILVDKNGIQLATFGTDDREWYREYGPEKLDFTDYPNGPSGRLKEEVGEEVFEIIKAETSHSAWQIPLQGLGRNYEVPEWDLEMYPPPMLHISYGSIIDGEYVPRLTVPYRETSFL
jgi:hypothetical protein